MRATQTKAERLAGLDLGPENRTCATPGCPNTFEALRGSRRIFCDGCMIARQKAGWARGGRPPKKVTVKQ